MKEHIDRPVCRNVTPEGKQKKRSPLQVGCLMLLAVMLVCVLTAAMPGSSAEKTTEETPIPVGEALEQVLDYPKNNESGGMNTANITPHCAVTVKCDGETRTIFTSEITVGEVLEQMEITLGEYDKVSMDLDTVITEDEIQIKVSRGWVTQTVEYVELPYGTEYIPDNSMADGSETVTKEGVTGLQMDTYLVIHHEGESEVTYQYLSSVVAYEPQAEQVTFGTYVQNSFLLPSGERVYYSKVMTCTATAYTDHSGIPTSTGTTPRVGAIAVDPTVIPYGTRMYIVTTDGSIVYGYATAEDCGGAIKGNRVDLYYNTESECNQFGRRSVLVYILD